MSDATIADATMLGATVSGATISGATISGETALVRVLPEDRRVLDARTRLMLARLRTRGTLTALRTGLSEKTDWHTWYRARPGLFLAAAFAAGFLLAKRR